MKDAVVIKGNKAGMTVYLEKDLDFDEVLQAIAKKFKATAKFWGAAQMTLTLEGRDQTPEEEYRVVRRSRKIPISRCCVFSTRTETGRENVRKHSMRD